ncbi:hypothetical protein MnTg04_00494 [bacterium MnTg04]|nr:hypothetical protein MnTg04_00494 [bacterium MnTg04]
MQAITFDRAKPVFYPQAAAGRHVDHQIHMYRQCIVPGFAADRYSLFLIPGLRRIVATTCTILVGVFSIFVYRVQHLEMMLAAIPYRIEANQTGDLGRGQACTFVCLHGSLDFEIIAGRRQQLYRAGQVVDFQDLAIDGEFLPFLNIGRG